VSQIRQVYPTDTSSDRKSKAKAAYLALGLAMAETTSLKGTKRDVFWQQKANLERLRYDSIFPGTKLTKEGVEKQEAKADALQHHAIVAGHGMICELFNRFPLRMFPCPDGAIELPSYDREGILPILYFLLRRDYRDRHYLIKVCKVCAATFKPERGDSDCCDRKCYKRYNDRDRYLKNKRLRKAA